MGERDQDTLIQAAQEDALSTDNAGGFGEIPYWGIITQHNALSYLPEYSQYPLDTALSTYFPPDSTTRYHTFQVLPLNPIASVSDNSVAQCYNFDLSNTQHSIPPSPVSTGWGPDSTPTAFFSPSAPPTDTSVLALQSWPHHSSSGYPIDHSPYSDDADQGAARLQDLVASSPQTRGDGARAEKRRSRRARVSEEPSRPNSAGSNRSTAPNNTRRRRRRKPRRRNTSISNPNHPAPSLQLETIAYHAGGRSTLFASSPSSTASFSDGMTGAGNLDDLNQQRHQLQQALLFPQSSSSSDTSSSFTSFFPEAESGAPSRKASSSSTLPSPVETTPTPSTTAGSTARQIALPPSSSRIRARNRIAANKCRAKHKVVVTKLEERDHEVTRQRQELKREVTQLQDEVFSLKQKLFEHSDCNCVGIRGYLESMARQIVQRATQARGADGELTEQ